jgi:hypothetical protein
LFSEGALTTAGEAPLCCRGRLRGGGGVFVEVRVFLDGTVLGVATL